MLYLCGFYRCKIRVFSDSLKAVEKHYIIINVNAFEKTLLKFNKSVSRFMKGIIQNSSNGFVSKEGVQVGFYRTRNKRYLEDSYVDIAKKLINGG